MKKLICSAGNKEDLQKMINEYFFSQNYIITDNNRVYNTKLEKYIDNTVEIKRGRYCFYHCN